MPKKKQQQEEADIPIASMIDVVFLLIIFFVVTASIDKEVDDEKIALADAPHSKPVAKKDPRSIVINVRTSGEMNIATIPLTTQQISQQLIAAASKWGNDMPIIIRGDRDTQHEYIKKVMKAITDTQLYRVKFMAVVNQ